jgi:hypothetical protein
LGKDELRPTEQRVEENVTLRLLEPFLDKGGNVTWDNFFTSLSLAKELAKRKAIIAGTLNNIPRDVLLCPSSVCEQS